MIRISLPYVLDLCENLEALRRLQSTDRVSDVVIDLWRAQSDLETLLNSSVFSQNLRSSRQLALALIQQIAKLTHVDSDWNRTLEYETASLGSVYDRFKTALIAEIGTFPAYFVSQKGSCDTITLLDEPYRLFPADLWNKIPEARFDIGEAGKALCYELATACGVHVFRAVECVVRRYYTEVTGGRPQPKVRNLAVYINAMRQAKKGDEKVLGTLEQLSKLHRNPLAHPDAVLSMDEAISIVGMAHSAMTAMLRHIPEPPKTTSTAA